MRLTKPPPPIGICFAWWRKRTPDGWVWLEWVHYHWIDGWGWGSDGHWTYRRLTGKSAGTMCR